MYLKKDLKSKIVNHLTEHLFTLERKKATPYRVAECKKLIALLQDIKIEKANEPKQISLFE